MNKIRLVVVDDHALFRAGLVSLLNEMAELEVVAEAENGQQALDVIHRFEPDVALIDVSMPVMNGVEAVGALREAGKECRLIMLTISKNDEDLFGAIQAGADGYLLKNAEPEELRKAILEVHSGRSVVSPEVTRPLLKALAAGKGLLMDGGLSKREVEVLDELALGKTTSQIAETLFVSENTVKTHVRHILEKLKAANRAEAVSKATQMGILRKA